MEERDFMMRQISQMATMIGRILGLKAQKKHEEAMALIDEFLHRELRMRSRLALALSDADLLQMLSMGGVPNFQAVAILAAFLQEEGDLLSETGQIGDAVVRYEKAFRLLVYALREGGPVKGLRMEARIRELCGRLAPYEIASETKRSLWGWQERDGRYADAENTLYELHDANAVTDEEGRDFYARLAQLEDAALTRGGLPRNELHDGLEQWIKRADTRNEEGAR